MPLLLPELVKEAEKVLPSIIAPPMGDGRGVFPLNATGDANGPRQCVNNSVYAWR